MPIILEGAELFADVYRERLTPWMTSDLSIFAGAIGEQFEEIYELISDRGTDGDPNYASGWSVLFDVDLCPAKYLPFLGQFVGVPDLVGVAEVTARALIGSQPSMHRGTPRSIINAAAATLTGTQTVQLVERYGGDPYAIRVVTYTAETPDQAATLAAILRMKPAGIVLTYDVLTGWTIGEMEAAYSALTIADLEGAFSSIADLEVNT